MKLQGVGNKRLEISADNVDNLKGKQFALSDKHITQTHKCTDGGRMRAR